MEYPGLIKKGSINAEAVKAIKKRLNEFGHKFKLSNPNFLSSTEKGVKQFQLDYGLEPDGIVGRKTWDKLFTMDEKLKDGKPNYQFLWDTMKIKEGKEQVVHSVANRIIANKGRYLHLLDIIATTYPDSTIPWQFVGLTHYMEATLSFKHHLHNGDGLEQRTIQVPKGRPAKGNPPFTWEQSAFDALCNVERLHTVTDWSIPALLYRLEKYNGLGYQKYHPNVLSPYLWSFSTFYTKGKYKSDGKFDPNLISQQIGAAVILKQIM